MLGDESKYRAIVIGGGFYGANIALYLADQLGGSVLLLEKEASLISMASYKNQARVHNGYHYPRSFTTAYRSRINLPRFIQDWPSAVKMDFTKLYAIARKNSKVTAKQFERFCQNIGAKIEISNEYSRIFNNQLVEKAFLVEEYVFDATLLEKWVSEQLEYSKVNVYLNSTVTHVYQLDRDLLEIIYTTENGIQKRIETKLVFNCTYSGLNQISGDFSGTKTKLKHELTEMVLLDVPSEFKKLGITMMDGPFFSLMPFPSLKSHTLSHVRYTPHFSWFDHQDINPYSVLSQYPKITRVDRMIRDVQRYMPEIIKAKYQDSLFEIKTILLKNEGDDGRPILFEEYHNLPGFYSILGGKIDNIYDALEMLSRSKLK